MWPRSWRRSHPLWRWRRSRREPRRPGRSWRRSRRDPVYRGRRRSSSGTIPERFLSRTVAFTALLPAVLLCGLKDLRGHIRRTQRADAAPTMMISRRRRQRRRRSDCRRWWWRPSSGTIAKRLFPGTIALDSKLRAPRAGDLEDSASCADPTELSTIPERFFSGTVASTAPVPALRPGGPNDPSVDAAPTGLSTIPERFFSGTVASPTPL